MTNEPIPMAIRIEDGDVSVALGSDDFENLVLKLVPEDEMAKMPCSIDRIIYVRGGLEKRNLWLDRLWWAAGLFVGIVFLYGLYALFRHGLS